MLVHGLSPVTLPHSLESGPPADFALLTTKTYENPAALGQAGIPVFSYVYIESQKGVRHAFPPPRPHFTIPLGTTLPALFRDTPIQVLEDPFTLRNSPLRFGDVRVPGYQNWDASMSNYFPIHERFKAQFRFEAVNALNRPWFTGIASVDVTNASFGRLNPVQGNLPRFLKLGLNLQF